jgi:hypothetical protein
MTGAGIFNHDHIRRIGNSGMELPRREGFRELPAKAMFAPSLVSDRLSIRCEASCSLVLKYYLTPGGDNQRRTQARSASTYGRPVR